MPSVAITSVLPYLPTKPHASKNIRSGNIFQLVVLSQMAWSGRAGK